MSHPPIYLDHQATTPMDPKVLEVMMPYFTNRYGNPSSRNHVFGWEAQEAVDIAKNQCAKLIGAKSSELTFTSGSTESINLALKGLLQHCPSKNHIITCFTEHRAVLDTCESLERIGGVVTYLPVNPDGLIDVSELEAAIRPNTGLICIQYANNETGVIQPIARIGAMAQSYQIPFFTDATQAVGKIPVSVQEDGIDMLCFSGHKMYGPKGIGVLYKRNHINLSPQIEGGSQQGGLRSGTLNVPAIVGIGEASAISLREMEQESHRLAAWRNELEVELLALEGVSINGSQTQRLPHCTNLHIAGLSGEAFILSLGSKLAFSQGAACSTVTTQLSHVLLAMGRHPSVIESSFRFGMGRFNTHHEMDMAKQSLKVAIEKQRCKAGYVLETRI